MQNISSKYGCSVDKPYDFFFSFPKEVKSNPCLIYAWEIIFSISLGYSILQAVNLDKTQAGRGVHKSSPSPASLPHLKEGQDPTTLNVFACSHCMQFIIAMCAYISMHNTTYEYWKVFLTIVIKQLFMAFQLGSLFFFSMLLMYTRKTKNTP